MISEWEVIGIKCHRIPEVWLVKMFPPVCCSSSISHSTHEAHVNVLAVRSFSTTRCLSPRQNLKLFISFLGRSNNNDRQTKCFGDRTHIAEEVMDMDWKKNMPECKLKTRTCSHKISDFTTPLHLLLCSLTEKVSKIYSCSVGQLKNN